MPHSIIILGGVFLLIAFRRIGTVAVEKWQSMTAGAIGVLLLGEISASEAVASIDIDVMLFLFGMFVIGVALEESGYLAHISYRLIKRTQNRNQLLFVLLFGAGGLSALLMNDTLAVIGVPVILLLARKHDMSPRPMLLGWCFAVTIGSVFSPIGNPQNLLISLSGAVATPFVSFFRVLFIPSVINLLICYWLLRLSFPDDFHEAHLAHSQEPIRDASLAFLSRVALVTIVVLIGVKVGLVALGWQGFPLTAIALGGAVPVLVGSPRRREILRRVDWKTLVFFLSMFVLMAAVWKSGFFQSALARTGMNILHPFPLLGTSIVISQFISNVPLVALLQPVLLHLGAREPELLLLAAGSTIAGNLLILGAASNVIILQNAEARSGIRISFGEFARFGIPLTIANATVYYLFFLFVS